MGQGAANGRSRNGHVTVRKHLEGLRVAELRDVAAFWAGEDATKGTKRELVERLEPLLTAEGTVYRRVRALTRKVLDVLLLLLRRDAYTSDLPGLFQRLPGEEGIELEFHEAEAGLKALYRRGFLAERSDRGMATNGRKLYAVPQELGEMMTQLFREETRTVKSVLSLAEHATVVTATERARWRERFPDLPRAAGPGDVDVVLANGGAAARIDELEAPLGDVVRHALRHHQGFMLRAQWSRREALRDVPWDRAAWAPALERAGVGTMGRLTLTHYGIQCDDDVLVVFREVLEDLERARGEETPDADEVLRARADLMADLCAYLEHVRRHPVRVSRRGEVYKAGRRRIQEGFVSRESSLAGPAEVWVEVHGMAEHLGLVGTDGEGFLELRPEADAFLLWPLEQKVGAVLKLALEQAGPRGRSLHQRELRTIVGELLTQEPTRWWHGRALASAARHRYLETLDARRIQDRYRDRFFTAYFSGNETPGDLLRELENHWLRRLYLFGLLDVAMKDDRPRAWRLSALGARVLGASAPEVETGLEPLLVNPDFEVLVLPEGDVSDVVHTLDGFAQRVKTDDVVHFRLTKEAVEAAVAAGRSLADFTAFLEARARGGVPQNVLYSLRAWAGSVTFATLERGIVLAVQDEEALDRILAMAGVERALVRRLGPTEALLKDTPLDRKVVAALRERGIELQGP